MEIGEPIAIPLPGVTTQDQFRAKEAEAEERGTLDFDFAEGDWSWSDVAEISAAQAATFVQAAAQGAPVCKNCAAEEQPPTTSDNDTAQAETFKQAAAQGTPFCETCGE